MPLEKQNEAITNKYRRQLDMLKEVSTRMQGLMKSPNLYREIVKIIQERFHYYHMSLWTVDAIGAATLQAADGAYEHVLQPGFVLQNEGIIGHVIKTREPRLCNDIASDINFSSLRMPTETRSALCIPVMMASDQVKAVINIESIYLDAFDDDDLHVMMSVAAQVSLALSNAALFRGSK